MITLILILGIIFSTLFSLDWLFSYKEDKEHGMLYEEMCRKMRL